jgi:hypothetical protein
VLIVTVGRAGVTPLITVRDISPEPRTLFPTANTTDVREAVEAVQRWLVNATTWAARPPSAS